MRMLTNSEPIPGTISELENWAATVHPGAGLSLESQLNLRSLYEYIDSCRLALDEIQHELSLYDFDNNAASLQRVSERLGKFCVEADNWGFNATYEIALGLQMLLLNRGGSIHMDALWEMLQRGLRMLSALLEQCERDFCWRLAISDMLDCLNQAAFN